MSAVKNIKKITPHVWIPPTYSPIYKIEIEDGDGNKTDITDDVTAGDYTDGVTNTVGSFNFTIDNSEENYTSLIQTNYKVNVYLDYDTSATTHRFTGIIEKASTGSNSIKITGRSSAAKIMGIKVTKTYSDEFTNVIIQDLIDSYASDILTKTNIDTTESTDTQVDVNFNKKPFWECIQELCTLSGYDAYIDKDFDFNYFVSGSRLNTTDVILHESNLIETGDFAPDMSEIKNRIIILGSSNDDVQVMWTEEDATSIAEYGLKEETIEVASIETIAQAKDRAIYELALKKDPTITGEVTSLGLATLLPGEKLRVSDPMNNLQPAYYAVEKFTHTFSNDDPLQTTVTLNKETSTIPKVLKKRITYETDTSQSVNPNELKYSHTIFFTYNSGTHSGTEIADNTLKVISGEGTGTWISPMQSIDGNVSQVELRVSGDSITGTTYYVTTDGGSTWTEVSPNVLTSVPYGISLGVKVVFANETAQLKAVGVFFDTA